MARNQVPAVEIDENFHRGENSAETASLGETLARKLQPVEQEQDVVAAAILGTAADSPSPKRITRDATSKPSIVASDRKPSFFL